MFAIANTTNPVKTTSHKIVLNFYLYAALSLLASTILLLFSGSAFTEHYFHPHTLAITHAMALGWGTMIILGASHQLIPVLIENNLYSTGLAHASFILAAIGIPLLVYGFYVFDMHEPAKWGGRFIVLAVLCYVINLSASIRKSKSKNVHAWFVFTASIWLFLTVSFGLVLVYNFTYPFLSLETLHYLPVHAHTGVIGWFLLLVIGVGSRLIPMFLISKYTNPKLLWAIFILINASLASFVIMFIYFPGADLFFLPVTGIIAGLVLFGVYCFHSYSQRIRKQLDEQMKISLLSVMMMLMPFIFLISIAGWLVIHKANPQMVLVYGFMIFFGWITAIIFGMTFKTLPFIVWNKVYHNRAGVIKTPNPKDLFSNKIFIIMSLVYLGGFILFIAGIILADRFVLSFAAGLLCIAAILYNANVIRLLLHKPAIA